MANRGLSSIGIRKIIPSQIDFTKIVSGSAAGPGSFIALSSDGTPVLVNAKNLIDDSLINHDSLTGFVSDEHVAHSTVSITAGSGLTGGGTIAATRTINIGAGTGITVNADDIQTNDSEIVHDNLSGFVSDEHVAHSAVSITAGNGLTGGGTIAATRTINVGAGTGITVASDSISFDPDGGTLSTSNLDVDHILINDGGVFKRIAPSNVNISSFNNDSGFTSNTGDMTGVSISVGTGLDITQTNTTSGDYSATINLDLTEITVGTGLDTTATGISLDLTEVISDDGTNRVLTSDGDGTLTAESFMVVSSTSELVGIGQSSPSKTLTIETNDSTTTIGSKGLSGGGAGTGVLIENTSTETNTYANLDFRAGSADARIALQYKGSSNNGEMHFVVDGTFLDTKMKIDSDGSVTKPYHPCFMATLSTQMTNIAINTYHTVEYDTEDHDIGSDFSTSTHTFTAPVDGRYLFTHSARVDQLDTSATWMWFRFHAAGSVYGAGLIDPNFSSDLNYWPAHDTLIVELDAGDTVYVSVYQAGGSSQLDVSNSTLSTRFAGFLIS